VHICFSLAGLNKFPQVQTRRGLAKQCGEIVDFEHTPKHTLVIVSWVVKCYHFARSCLLLDRFVYVFGLALVRPYGLRVFLGPSALSAAIQVTQQSTVAFIGQCRQLRPGNCHPHH
jgi:hypothetical protein